MHYIFKYRRINTLYAILSLSLCFSNCRRLIDVDAPVTSVNVDNVYATDATAISALTTIYKKMSSRGTFTGLTSISLLSGLSSDELTLYSGVTNDIFIRYYKNNLMASPTINIGTEFWAPLYNYIFICNAAIEGLSASNSLTPEVKQQLMGEAKFMRAFFNFYLVNLFGDIPLSVTTDYKINATLERIPKTEVYQHIIEDLKEAQNLLSSNYLNGNLKAYNNNSERIRPNKWTAIALLSRVYLYVGDYVNSETQSDLIINNSSLFNLNDLSDVFKKNSTEAIWQLQPVTSGRNTEDGWVFTLPKTGPNDANVLSGYPVYLSKQLLDSFEVGDQRISKWIDSVKPTPPGNITYYYPSKYKSATLNAPITEYLMIFRLAEQYLIRAEARAQQNNISGAQADLNRIRTRAKLPDIKAEDKSSILKAILHERQVELFSELGQRWFDLKRTNNIDAKMSIVTVQKGGTWESRDQLYPIPLSDIQKNRNLIQNPGYE